MSATNWTDWLDDDDAGETGFSLSREECIEDLLRDAPAGCVYCRLSDAAEGDDE